MKRIVALALSAVMLTCSFFGVCTIAYANGNEITVKYEQTEARKMINYVNDFRSQKTWCWDESSTTKVTYMPTTKLKYDYDLERSAMIRAAEISEKFEHERPCGKGPFTTYTYYGSAGENIAYTTGHGLDAGHMFELWLEENEDYSGQGHRRTMLGESFGAIGVACCLVGDTYYWVQEFRDVVVEPNPTPANNGYATMQIDYTGTVMPSLVGVKAPALKVPTVKVTSPKKKQVKISWNSQANVKNYQIQYSYNKNFKSAKKVTVAERYGSMSIGKMKSKKKVYIRVRAKNKSTGKYTNWSKTKTIKVK